MPEYNSIPAQGDSPGKALIIVEWIAVLMMLVALALRFSARKVQGQKPSFDDWACAFGSIFVITLSALGTVSVTLAGLGQIDGLKPASLALTFKLYAPKEICWSFANTSIKLSFIAFFRRVFNLQKYKTRFYIASGMTVALGVGNLIQCLAMCRPYEFLWDKNIPGGVCGNQDLALLLVAVFSVVVDVVIFALPVPILWGLHISRKKRQQLISVFCLGICITTIPIVRIFLTIPLWQNPEKTDWWVCIIEIFYQLELSLALIAACVPTWKPLIRYLSNKKVNSSAPSSHRTLGYNHNRGSASRESWLVPLSQLTPTASQAKFSETRHSEENSTHVESAHGDGISSESHVDNAAPLEGAEVSRHAIVVTTAWDVSSKAKEEPRS